MDWIRGTADCELLWKQQWTFYCLTRREICNGLTIYFFIISLHRWACILSYCLYLVLALKLQTGKEVKHLPVWWLSFETEFCWLKRNASKKKTIICEGTHRRRGTGHSHATNIGLQPARAPTYRFHRQHWKERIPLTVPPAMSPHAVSLLAHHCYLGH